MPAQSIDGTIVLVCERGEKLDLCRIDLSTFDFLWETPLDEYLGMFINCQGTLVASVYMGSEIMAFESKSGKVVWRKSIAEIGPVPGIFEKGQVGGECFAIGDRAIFPVAGKKILALEAHTGNLDWISEVPVLNPLRATTVNKAGHLSIFSTTFCLLDTATGHISRITDYKSEFNHLGFGLFSNHVIVANHLYVGSTKKGLLIGIDLLTNKMIWEYSTLAPLHFDPFIAGRRLYVVDKLKNCYVFDLQSL